MEDIISRCNFLWVAKASSGKTSFCISSVRVEAVLDRKQMLVELEKK
jgi:hypothetical protein